MNVGKIFKLGLIFGVFLAIGCGQVGSKAPDFTLQRVNRATEIALEDFRGKPVFLDFWASWCPPCRQSTPDVKRLSREFSNKIQVIGINMDQDINAARSYIRSNNIQFINLRGNQKVSSAYKVSGIPAFFIIDSEGRIVQSYSGYRSEYYDEWRREIRNIIN